MQFRIRKQTGWPWVYREQVDVAGLPPFDPEFEANYFSCCCAYGGHCGCGGDRCGRCHYARIASSSSWRLVSNFDPRTIGHDRHRGGGAVLVGERKKPWSKKTAVTAAIFVPASAARILSGRIGYCTFATEDNLSTFDRVTSLQMPEADHDFGPDSADKLLAALATAFPYVGLVTIGGGPGLHIAGRRAF